MYARIGKRVPCIAYSKNWAINSVWREWHPTTQYAIVCKSIQLDAIICKSIKGYYKFVRIVPLVTDPSDANCTPFQNPPCCQPSALHNILDTRFPSVCPSVTLRGPPQNSETVWTGVFWSKPYSWKSSLTTTEKFCVRNLEIIENAFFMNVEKSLIKHFAKKKFYCFRRHSIVRLQTH